MAITIDDFSKIWASTSPLTPYEFSENQYKEGWNFVGATPPSRQMWDFLQKNNDEKMQYLANNYLPLSGGTMTGQISHNGNFIKAVSDASYVTLCGSNAFGEGAGLILYGKNNADGTFVLSANDANNQSSSLYGRANGSLTWNGKNVVTEKAFELTNQASFSVSSNNATVTSKAVYKTGSVIWADLVLKTTTAVNVGGTITVDISGIPLPVIQTASAGYSGSVDYGIYVYSDGHTNVRVLTAGFGSGDELVMAFSYPTS